MARPYKTKMSKRIIMRRSNGRFRKTIIEDLGVSRATLQDGPAVCINCGHGADVWWHPVMKEGFCPKCKSRKKISVSLLPAGDLCIPRESAVNIALSMYANEPCRVCGKEITMKDLNEGAVFAGYSKCDTSRTAHKKCWDQNKPMSEWVYD